MYNFLKQVGLSPHGTSPYYYDVVNIFKHAYVSLKNIPNYA
jgi:hypothetical protein